MTGDPRIHGYDWVGGREAMLCFGPETGPVVIAALPLFEEANRTRAFMVGILRALAMHGISSALPDVPGQGESLALLEATSLADMRTAFAAAVAYASDDGRAAYVIAIRSGALLDGRVLPTGANPYATVKTWHLAPQDGVSLRRDLTRIKHAESGAGAIGNGEKPVLVAGNLLSPALLSELAASVPGEANRIVRLATDPAPADRRIDGAPPWRRSEPDTDAALSQSLADDIAQWIATCEA